MTLATFPRSPIADRLEHIWRMAFRAPFSPAFPGLFSAGAVTPPWLAGGVPASYIVAAYNPKGAASYTASKINLANPGTHDAANGATYPTWNVTTGWFFDALTKYLITGITPTSLSWSMIARIGSYSTSGNFCAIAGASDASGNNRFYLWTLGATNPNRASYANGGENFVSPNLNTSGGVMVVAGANCYRNGVSDGTITQVAQTNQAITIGKDSKSLDNYGLNGYLLALWIYNNNVSAYQAALYNSIMAL